MALLLPLLLQASPLQRCGPQGVSKALWDVAIRCRSSSCSSRRWMVGGNTGGRHTRETVASTFGSGEAGGITCHRSNCRS